MIFKNVAVHGALPLYKQTSCRSFEFQGSKKINYVSHLMVNPMCSD